MSTGQPNIRTIRTIRPISEIRTQPTQEDRRKEPNPQIGRTNQRVERSAAPTADVIQSVGKSLRSTDLGNRASALQSPDPSSSNWIQGLQRFIFENIAPLVEADPNRRNVLVDSNAMKVWKVAFTDQSYNPNTGENYESLEKIGDAFMKAAFNQYLEEKFPDITQLELSEIVSHYLSKPELAAISQRLGLGSWVRTHLDKNTHMFEDLVEAVFGALVKIGNEAYQVGVGYIFCYNLVVNIFENIKIDRSVSIGRPKTQIKQLFDKMYWGKVIGLANADDNGVIFEIRFTRKALNDLANLGIHMDDVIARGSGSTKTMAENSAYDAALRELNKIGITQEWANEHRSKNEFDSPDLAPYYPTALRRLRREGFESMTFANPRTSNRTCFIQLLGIKDDGRKEVLITVSECSAADGKREALRRYANGE